MSPLDLAHRAAFSQLLVTERTSLMRMARRILGDAALAEDVIQTLWLNIQRITDPEAIKDKRAYLYRLMLNLTSDQRRKRMRGAGLIRNIDQFKVSGLEFQSTYDNGVVFGDLSAHYYFEAKTCAPDIAAERREYGEKRNIAGLKNTPDCVDGGFEGSYSNTQNPPRFNLNLTLGAHLFDDRLTIGGRAVHNSGPISKLDKDWNVGLSAIQQLYKEATIYDAFASLKVTEQTKLDLNIDNVMDEYHLDPLALGVMPAPGRTVRLALTYRY